MHRFYSSEAYLKDVSERIKQYRISAEYTQKELADKAGISLRSLQYFENGTDIKFETLIKIIMALGLDDNLEFLVPDVNAGPIRSLEIKKHGMRKRVRKKNDTEVPAFKWGDEK